MGVIMLLLTWASCTEEITNVHSDGLKQIVITAPDFETEVGSRTNFQITNAGAEFSWAANDTVGIFPSEGAQAYFPMTSGAGTKTANFNGGGWALKDASTYAAYYPFIGDFYLDKNAVPVDYSGQIQTGDASTTHLGAYDYMVALPAAPKNGLVNFAFKHLGALVQLKLTIPHPTIVNSVTLTTDDDAFALKGRVNIMAENAVIESVATSNEMTLVVENVTTTEVNQVVTLYMMLPPVDLSSKTLKAVVGTTSGNENMILQSKNFQAGKAYALSNEINKSFQYYQIPTNELNGWDEGFYYADESGTVCPYYIVSSTDSVNSDIIVCLNETSNTDAEKSLIFHFSEEGDVLKVLLSGCHFEAQSEDDKVIFVVYDTEGNAMGGFSVPYVKIETMPNTRSPFFNSKGELSGSKILNFAEFMEKGANVLGNAWNLSEGNYGEVVADFLLGTMAGSVKSIFARMFVPQAAKDILGWHYEETKRSFMGNADIQISSVKRTSETNITIEGKISNISSIPPSRLGVADGQMGYTSNKIFYGVAVGKNAYPGLYLNENCTNLQMVSKEDFSFTFYMEDTPGEVFYFRPFLIPESKIQYEDDLLPDLLTCIRYGEAKKFVDMTVELSNFKQVKCEKHGDEYNVQFTIDGKIPELFDDLAGWGIKVSAKSKSKDWGLYYATKENPESYFAPTENTFTCDIKITENEITDNGIERIAEVIITPFISYRGSILNDYLEDESYTLTISGEAIDLGLSVKWASHNVGASSPEGYGGYYAWGETEEKSDYDWVTYNYGGINIGSNISGTQYDVAHVKWGGSWRMPTRDEINELVNKCTWKWTSLNGVNGQLVTGPNGNSIFLPAAGCRYDAAGGLGSRGSTGGYWSATLSENNGYCACAFDFYYGDYGWCNCYDRFYGCSVRPVTE